MKRKRFSTEQDCGRAQGHCQIVIERDEAERVAWLTPGVSKVDDRIMVRP